jgi:hypothetical protein
MRHSGLDSEFAVAREKIVRAMSILGNSAPESRSVASEARSAAIEARGDGTLVRYEATYRRLASTEARFRTKSRASGDDRGSVGHDFA